MWRVMGLLLVAALLSAGPSGDALAASKKPAAKPKTYTEAQRKRIYDLARQLCKKKHGGSGRVEVDYQRLSYRCYYQ